MGCGEVKVDNLWRIILANYILIYVKINNITFIIVISKSIQLLNISK